jgi:hypothetical protein
VNWNTLNNELTQALLAAGLVEELLEDVGCALDGQRGRHFYRFPCPVHGGLRPNCEVRLDGETVPVHWRCYSQGCHVELKPSLLGLVRGALNAKSCQPVPLKEAVQYVRDFLRRNGADGRPAARRPRPAPFRPVECPSWSRDQVRARLEIPSPYFLKRGFSAAVLDYFDIGHSPYLGRTVAPVYDKDGRCVGSYSRSEHPECPTCGLLHNPGDPCERGEPRWQCQKRFRKSDYLYNFAATRGLSYPHFVLLVEGVPDVLRASEAGYTAVAVFGTELSDRQSILLEPVKARIAIAFDNDEAGRAAAVEARARLGRGHARVPIWHPPDPYKDLGDMPADEAARHLRAFLPAANPWDYRPRRLKERDL